MGSSLPRDFGGPRQTRVRAVARFAGAMSPSGALRPQVGSAICCFSRPERKFFKWTRSSHFARFGYDRQPLGSYVVACLRFFTTTGEEPGSVHHHGAHGRKFHDYEKWVTVARAHKQSFKHNIISEWRIALACSSLLAPKCGTWVVVTTVQAACKGEEKFAPAFPCRSVERNLSSVRQTRVFEVPLLLFDGGTSTVLNCPDAYYRPFPDSAPRRLGSRAIASYLRRAGCAGSGPEM